MVTVNDLVWLHNPRVLKGSHRKLKKRWTGPYEIVKRISDLNYKIKHTSTRKQLVVHFNRLKFCGLNMRYDQDSPEEGPFTAVGSNIEIIDMAELRTTRPPARYDDFVRHDSRVRDQL